MNQIESCINQIKEFKALHNRYPFLPIRVKYRYKGKPSENELKPNTANLDDFNVPNVKGSIRFTDIKQAGYWEIIYGLKHRKYCASIDEVASYQIFRFLSKINLDDQQLEEIIMLYDGEGVLFPNIVPDMCKQKPVARELIIHGIQRNVNWVE